MQWEPARSLPHCWGQWAVGLLQLVSRHHGDPLPEPQKRGVKGGNPVGSRKPIAWGAWEGSGPLEWEPRLNHGNHHGRTMSGVTRFCSPGIRLVSRKGWRYGISDLR